MFPPLFGIGTTELKFNLVEFGAFCNLGVIKTKGVVSTKDIRILGMQKLLELEKKSLFSRACYLCYRWIFACFDRSRYKNLSCYRVQHLVRPTESDTNLHDLVTRIGSDGEESGTGIGLDIIGSNLEGNIERGIRLNLGVMDFVGDIDTVLFNVPDFPFEPDRRCWGEIQLMKQFQVRRKIGFLDILPMYKSVPQLLPRTEFFCKSLVKPKGRCRNLPDLGRLKSIESSHGVQLVFRRNFDSIDGLSKIDGNGTLNGRRRLAFLCAQIEERAKSCNAKPCDIAFIRASLDVNNLLVIFILLAPITRL